MHLVGFTIEVRATLRDDTSREEIIKGSRQHETTGKLSRYMRIRQNPHSGSIRNSWSGYAGCLVQTSLLVTAIKIRDILASLLVTSQSTFNLLHLLCVPSSWGCALDLSIRFNTCLHPCTDKGTQRCGFLYSKKQFHGTSR